ncbi:SURF1 family cytochrome oxidase biogenesis protein [Rhodococcus sp. MEB064]|uniref:SURF1 family cytochrome oxidase biogenesis protein n=1 Tax=Rhodococcus sp. MEB064 TaxID=1587522 RepID=UPI0005ABBC52|nr:SURF1 family protein [Rhodococcus sp. MEB064]KIQ16238.1 hypothetical protein RU01_14360 [Rhodococcus sp. MEB064]
MRRLSFLVRPGWLALAAVVILFAYLCFTVLAPWQLGKNTTTSARNDQISRSFDADPVAAGDLVADRTVAPDEDWRRVRLTGTYESGKDVVVRLRSVDDTPAFEVLTPFVTDVGPTILVNRGYVLPTTGIDVPSFAPAPAGQTTLEGRLRASEPSVPDKPAVSGPGIPQVYTITPAQVGPLTGTDLIDGYVQLAEDQPGGLGVIALPQLDAGPYLSYGLQWLAFGLMAPLGLAYFVRAELRERRRDKTGTVENTPVTAPSTDSDEYDDGLDALLQSRRGLRRSKKTQTTPDSVMTDRYGDKR